MEPVQTQDVKPGSSAGGVKVESPSTEELVKLKADNERLKGAMSSLQSERDEIRAERDRLRDIEERRNLTASEEAKLRKLDKAEDNIDDQIAELRRKPEAKPWFTHLEREVMKATKAGASEAGIERAADFLLETAEELSEKDEFKGMTDDQLLKKIKPYMGQFENLSPYLKTKKAFKAWMNDESFRKEKAEAAKKKAEENLSREDGGRSPRETSAQEIFNKSELNTSDRATLREKLGIMQRAK